MLPAFASAQVTNTRSPQSTGEEWPMPGSSAFQVRFDSPISVGMLLASLIPEPFGPRKRVLSCAVAEIAKTETKIKNERSIENARGFSRRARGEMLSQA